MASNESENSIQSPPMGQYMMVVEESEASFSSSNPTNPMISVQNTCRSNNSGNRVSQFSKSISENRSSEESNRDSSKDDLFSKKSTDSNHVLRVIIEGVFQENEYASSRANGLMSNPTSRLFMLRHTGCHFALTGAYEKAVTCFSLLVKEAPQNGLNHSLLGLSYLALGSPEQALANFESALIFLPDIRDPNIWIAIATSLQQIRRPEIAMQAYHRVLRLVPRFPHLSYIHFQLACLEQCLGFYDLAIQHYKQAVLDNFPNNAYRVNALSRIAYCYASKGQRKLALNSLEAAISFDRSNVLLYHRLAAFYYQQGNLQKMEDTLNGVLRIEPREWCTHYLLGRLYDIKDEEEKAKERLVDAMKYSSKLKPEVMCTLGVWAAKNNQPFQALEAFKQAVVTSEDDTAWHNIGVLYHQHQQYEQAMKAFQKIKKARQEDGLISRPDDWDHFKLPQIEPHRQLFIDPPFYKKVSHKPLNMFPVAMNEQLPVFFQESSEYKRIKQEFPPPFAAESLSQLFNSNSLNMPISREEMQPSQPESGLRANWVKEEEGARSIQGLNPQIMQLQLSEELTGSAEKRVDGTPQLYVKTEHGYVPVCLVSLSGGKKI